MKKKIEKKIPKNNILRLLPSDGDLRVANHAVVVFDEMYFFSLIFLMTQREKERKRERNHAKPLSRVK